jgi:hypothetical protein
MRERERRRESWQCSEEEEEEQGKIKKRFGIVRGARLWYFNFKIMHWGIRKHRNNPMR